MNKRAFIKYIFVVLAAIISFYFIVTNEQIGINSMFSWLMLVDLLIALGIFMFFNRKKINKLKLIYNFILILLLLFTVAFLSFFFYEIFRCYFNISCGQETSNIFMMFYPIFLFMMLLFSFTDVFGKTNKTNDILIISISILIILVHLRYYFDTSLPHRIIEDEKYLQDSYYYITQNYIYFVFMYLISLIHYRVNKN